MFNKKGSEQMTNLQDFFDDESLKRKFRTPSKETRAKLSESLQGKIGNNLGRSVSDETRAKISATNKGKNSNGPIMTPNGVFKNRDSLSQKISQDCEITIGTALNRITKYMKQYPNDYYYINQKNTPNSVA